MSLFGSWHPSRAVLNTVCMICILLHFQHASAEWRFLTVPFANFTADKGIGYGVFASTFDEKTGAKPPYFASIGGQFYQTTGGYAFHKLLFDLPRDNYRLSLSSGWEDWSTAPYFGSGARTIRNLSTPKDYYTVDLGSLWIQPQARIVLTPKLESLILLTYRHAFLRGGENLLAATAPRGETGGRLLLVSTGLMVDKRDREPTPNQGFWTESTVGIASTAFGSDFNMQTVNITHRHWWSLDSDSRFVLAIRTLLDLQRQAPFFQESAFGGSQTLEVGGHSMLRGLETGRIRGPRKAAQTIEFHTRFRGFKLLSKRIETMIVNFAEVVYVARNGQKWASADHLLASVGIGARGVVDGAFVLRFDFGMTPELIRIENGTTQWRNSMGSYLIVGHSF